MFRLYGKKSIGQSSIEFILILAGIMLLAVFVLNFLLGVIGDLSGSAETGISGVESDIGNSESPVSLPLGLSVFQARLVSVPEVPFACEVE